MAPTSDAAALGAPKELLKSRPKDPIDEAIKLGRTLPSDWRGCSIADLVVWLRRRFDMTQRQLADLSGLSPARIAKIEKGQDVPWSTLCQLFAGFGCGITIVPMSRFGAEGLWRRTHDLSGDGHIARRRRYPRK